MSDKITAPFTIAQVDALNRFQRAGYVHPFTCANDHSGDRELLATKDGWICPNCDYRQNWAHASMAGELPPMAELFADAQRNLIAREIWAYNECPWNFDNPPEGMAQLQKQIAVDQAERIRAALSRGRQ